MQIHELNNFEGALDSQAFMVIDNGTDTGKISKPKLFAETDAAINQVENDLTAATTVLNQRIDTIIAGGAAPSEAEIIDARVGQNGITYGSLGDAIRGQATELKTDIEAITDVGIMNPTYVGKYIALNGGVGSIVNTNSPTTYPGYNSYVVSCTEGEVFTLHITGGTTPRAYAWLDEDKKILYAHGANETVNGKITAVSDAAYLVVNDNSGGYVLRGKTTGEKNTELMVEVDQRAFSNGRNITVDVSNAFDKNKATTGKYIAGDGVTEVTNSSYFHSDYIVISRATITGFTGGSLTNLMVLYDANKNVVDSGQISSYINATLPENAIYCRFNGGMSAIDAIALTIRVNTNGIYKAQVEGLAGPAIVKVGTGGTYATLKEAVDYAATLSSYQPVEIHVEPGTYNALDGFNLATESATFTGLELPDNVSIIGDGDKDDIIIKAELPVDMSAYSFDRNNVSTLNFWKNNSLKNVTVKAKNMRYAVHNDDYKTHAVPDAVETFEDCAFIYEALSPGVDYNTVSKVPFGTGMASGRRMSFKRCLFETDEAESKFAALIHNNTEQIKICAVEFESCQFVGGWGGSLKVSSAGSDVTDVIELKGCKGGKIYFAKESIYTGTDSEFKLFGYGNSFTGYTYDGITERATDTEMML